MGLSFSKSLLFLLLISSLFLMVASGAALLFVKARKYSSRVSMLASLIFFMQVIGIIGIIATSLSSQNISQPFQYILKPGPLIVALPIFTLLLLYIMESKRPKSFSHKKFALAILPIILLVICILVIPDGYTHLSSARDVATNIKKPDVMLRVILAAMYPIYTLAIIFYPRDKMRNSLPLAVLHRLQLVNFLATVNFILSLNLAIHSLVPVHIFLICLLDCQIMNIELSIRLSDHVDTGKTRKKAEISYKEDRHPFFDNPEIWMNPEITASELAHIMGTNQTYLAEQIKICGYNGFRDMINHKRVEYICEVLKTSGKEKSIIQLMFDAGFRSRSTASSEFKRITGLTPSEYLKQLS